MYFFQITNSRFFRDTLSLSGGTAIAQIIAIVTIPILTRLYTPEEFGVLALYTAVASLLSFIGSLKLEQVIMLSEDDRAAVAILATLFISCTTFALMVSVTVYFLGECFLGWVGKPELNSWVYLLPISVFLMGCYQGLRFWQMRQKAFKLVSVSLIASISTNTIVAILIGFLGGKFFEASGLLIAYILQTLVNVLILLRGTSDLWHMAAGMSRKFFVDSIRPHKQLIQTLLVSQGIAVIHSKLPSIAISSIFGNTALGFFSMAERVVTAPSLLVANALGDVYRQRASVAWRDKRYFVDIYKKTLLLTLFIGIPTHLVGIYMVEDVFVFVLGDEWRLAGVFAKIIMVAGMIGFITTPLDKGAIIVGAKKFILTWNILRLIGVTFVITVVLIYKLSFNSMIWFLVINNIVAYLVNLWFEYKFSLGSNSCY